MADLTIAGNVARIRGRTRTGTAGEDITAGDVVYEDFNDSGKLKACINSSLTTANAVGIALGDGGDGEQIVYQIDGEFDPGTNDAASGSIYVVSATAGGMMPQGDISTSEFITVVGVGNGNGNIDLSIFASTNQTPGT